MNCMRTVGQIMRGILSFRHHYIMKIQFDDFLNENKFANLCIEKISDYSELISGTYSIALQTKIMESNKGKCDAYVLKNGNQDRLGIVSVMYKGGNELEYKIRDIDAFLYNIKIEKRFRGNGYAGVMIKMIGKKLLEDGIQDAYLAVSTDNYNAIRAYQKVGFEIIDEKRFVRMFRKNIPYHNI